MLLASFVSLALATAPVQLYAHSLETHELSINLGVLTYNETSGSTQVIDAPELPEFEEGDYCIGAEINGNFQCHSYARLEFPLRYELIISTKPKTGELISMSFRRAENEGIKSIIKPAVPGAQPATKEAPKVVKNAEGKEVLEEEEPPKSFIQKYWMYIVPALIMFMISSGQEPQGQ